MLHGTPVVAHYDISDTNSDPEVVNVDNLLAAAVVQEHNNSLGNQDSGSTWRTRGLLDELSADTGGEEAAIYSPRAIKGDFRALLQEASCSKALVLLGDFNYPNICWKSNTASCRQSRRFLECLDNNFLGQEIDSPTQGFAILDLIVTNASELIRDVKIGGSLGCSDHALVEFTVLRDTCQTRSIVRKLNFRKANFQLFKELVNRTPWETVLRDQGGEAGRSLRTLSIEHKSCKKSSKKGKRPAWLSQDLLVKLKGKKELQRQFKQDQVSWEEYRDSAWLCRDEVKKAKAQLELNLERDAKNNKKGFYRYINQKRKAKESVHPHDEQEWQTGNNR
ncbi:nedd4-binding protein 2-like 2 [Limosa lapponica baueri]|uniref:Nedd4-binding protein 2-like 2 n=1 Tax=Limosa lapponica baueri TaxID=1758121 RepID=A0A2I0TFK9_LIMLA|nr:nedd4-binding protein 2-like 2 [Limosa lapponica baueri]